MPIGRNEFEKMRVQHQQNLREFLRVELELGLTFIEMAEVERDRDNIEHFQHAKGDVEKAVATIRRFVSEIGDPQEQDNIKQRCEELSAQLAKLP